MELNIDVLINSIKQIIPYYKENWQTLSTLTKQQMCI
uniref:Uncharacterized protein n=1 Tax=viral metagenome TaxID=1070528 RepID=A0A6C0H3N6_9ZZZZ